MSTEIYGDVVREAALGGGMTVRARNTFGPGAFIAPVQQQVPGIGVSALGVLDVTSAKRTPAAVANGAVSGLRTWSRDPV